MITVESLGLVESVLWGRFCDADEVGLSVVGVGSPPLACVSCDIADPRELWICVRYDDQKRKFGNDD